MKTRTFGLKLSVLFATTIALLVATSVRGQNAVHYATDPDGQTEIKMEGTSTLHDWTVISKLAVGTMDADASFPDSALKPDAATLKPKVELSIPVRSLKSTLLVGASSMDGVMREKEHLDEAEFKQITYKLLELKPKGTTNGMAMFDAVGELTVRGKMVTNTMPVSIRRDGKTITVSGSTPLKMTAFGVKPPAPTILGMPTISTGDDIKITFTWASVQKAP